MKLALVTIACLLAISSAGVWYLISERQATRDKRADFLGTSKSFPTSGGEKMKVEW